MSDSDTSAVSAASMSAHAASPAFCPDEARIAADMIGGSAVN
jgi:hypothetical protein